MELDEIKKYWDDRASNYGSSPQATTDDYYLREVEYNNLRKTISALKQTFEISSIADIGCGDGHTTRKLAEQFPEISFAGFDYSKQMIANAKNTMDKSKSDNLKFDLLDISKSEIQGKYDLIYTTRCLINLNSFELQKSAIKKILAGLNDGGHFLMIENFIDGNNEFNSLRNMFDLQTIKVRDHNLYFDQDCLMQFLENKCTIDKVENISSLYYIISRIVYSKICQLSGTTPDYYDIHHKIGSELPNLGNYGPIKMLTLKKL